MHRPIVSIKDLPRLMIVGLCVAALSACSGGGGDGPGPEVPSPVSLTLPVEHGVGAGEITVPAGASEEHGNVIVTCPGGGESCVLTIAADGSAAYDRTGGTPAVAYPPPRRTAAALNDFPAPVRRRVADRIAETAGRAVVSSTASTTAIAPATGGRWNTGVTQAPLNSGPNSPRDNRAVNARYIDGKLVFERIELEQGLVQHMLEDPEPPAYRTVVSPAGTPQWKGVEHFFITHARGKFYSLFYSDIESNDDGDYLALGVWAWVPGPDSPRIPFVGAAASGNDPFVVEHITAVSGEATYEGSANGLYAAGGMTPRFRGFGADVTLTADFDGTSIGGSITDGRDSTTGDVLFHELELGTATIGSTHAAFFSGEVTGQLGGKNAQGQWGGQFYGNGIVTADIPVSHAEAPRSVAGTFGAQTLGGDSLLGVFGAYRERP